MNELLQRAVESGHAGNAAWSGSADLVELLIARGAPINLKDPGFDSTPLGYAVYDMLIEKRHPEGQFLRTIAALLNAGATFDKANYPTGHGELDELLRAHGV